LSRQRGGFATKTTGRKLRAGLGRGARERNKRGPATQVGRMTVRVDVPEDAAGTPIDLGEIQAESTGK
jgi:hypothetical protein